MEMTFYTVDDLRLLRSSPQGGAWRFYQFDSLTAAVEQYQALPPTVEKSLGVIRKGHVWDLVRCLPLLLEDLAEADVLMADFLHRPEWQGNTELLLLSNRCVAALGIRYYLDRGCVYPAPTSCGLPSELQAFRLWANSQSKSAIQAAYLSGVGWASMAEIQRRKGSNRYPLVEKYRVDAMTEDGTCVTLEVTPNEFTLLEQQGTQRIHAKNRSDCNI